MSASFVMKNTAGSEVRLVADYTKAAAALTAAGSDQGGISDNFIRFAVISAQLNKK